jgi:hypothetical protein
MSNISWYAAGVIVIAIIIYIFYKAKKTNKLIDEAVKKGEKYEEKKREYPTLELIALLPASAIFCYLGVSYFAYGTVHSSIIIANVANSAFTILLKLLINLGILGAVIFFPILLYFIFLSYKKKKPSNFLTSLVGGGLSYGALAIMVVYANSSAAYTLFATIGTVFLIIGYFIVGLIRNVRL